MAKFFVVWVVFSFKNSLTRWHHLYRALPSLWVKVLRYVLRYGHIPSLLFIARGLCALRLIGRSFRLQNAVARENYRCLTGDHGGLNAAWIAVRRRILEEGATWGQNRILLQQIQACAGVLESVVAPLHQRRIPIILAPLHTVSDVLAAMVGASVTPGKASVVVSASAELYNQHTRVLGGIQLSYCSIHQGDKALASSLASLIMDVSAGKQNMIIFPDISPDYTLQAEGALAAKLPCRLFGRAAKLHQGLVRLSTVINAQVVFYNLFYDGGLRICINPPVLAKNVARVMPEIIEQTLREYPRDWLLWHSHSLYFINH